LTQIFLRAHFFPHFHTSALKNFFKVIFSLTQKK
jgi:hypothetical protein